MESHVLFEIPRGYVLTPPILLNRRAFVVLGALNDAFSFANSNYCWSYVVLMFCREALNAAQIRVFVVDLSTKDTIEVMPTI